MKTKVYFIRHAEPNYNNHDDLLRELSPKGLQDSQQLVNLFQDKQIDAFYSSPYKRAIDTIAPLASFHHKEIGHITDFRERKITTHWIEDFTGFTEQQWSDFSYHLPGGESLQEVQDRNIAALLPLLVRHEGQTLVICTHGTALSTILHYYQPSYTLEEFNRIKHIFPYIICLTFEKLTPVSMQEISLYDKEKI